MSIHKIDELVFCSNDIPSRDIIKNMTLLNNEKIEYKIAPPESLSIIGSNSINTSGDLYLIHFNSVGKGSNRRNKRLFDILSSLLLILFSPVLFLFIKKYYKVFFSSFRVLSGEKTWISYCAESDIEKLPGLKKGIFDLWDGPESEKDPDIIDKLNLEYARNYRLSSDLNLLWKKII